MGKKDFQKDRRQFLVGMGVAGAATLTSPALTAIASDRKVLCCFLETAPILHRLSVLGATVQMLPALPPVGDLEWMELMIWLVFG